MTDTYGCPKKICQTKNITDLPFLPYKPKTKQLMALVAGLRDQLKKK